MLSNNKQMSGIHRAMILETFYNQARIYIPGISKECPINSIGKIDEMFLQEHKNNFPIAKWACTPLYADGFAIPCWVVFENGDLRHPVVTGYFPNSIGLSGSANGSMFDNLRDNFIGISGGEVTADSLYVSRKGYIWPVPATENNWKTITSPFSGGLVNQVGDFHVPNTGRLGHKGIDLGLNSGTKIVAISDGIAIVTKNNGDGYGHKIRVKHISGDGYTSWYCHLYINKPFAVNNNDIVKAGQLIGYSGNTGNSTGPHLHFGIHNGNEFIDPMRLY